MKQCKTLPFMFLRSMFVLFLSCLSVNTLGQSLTVSGTVTDEKGEPIIGASEQSELYRRMVFNVDRKSTRLNSSHWNKSRMPSSA